MSSWQIKVLYYGKIRVPKSGLTPNLDPDLTLDFPYLGFLLRQGKRTFFQIGRFHIREAVKEARRKRFVNVQQGLGKLLD
jgi:hypothetical protein